MSEATQHYNPTGCHYQLATGILFCCLTQGSNFITEKRFHEKDGFYLRLFSRPQNR